MLFTNPPQNATRIFSRPRFCIAIGTCCRLLSDPQVIVATAFFYGASMVHPKRFFDSPLTAMTVACFTGFFIVFLKKKILLGLIPEFSMAIVPIVFSLATLYNFVLQRKDYNEENPEDDEDNDDDDEQERTSVIAQ